jgi:hypothetical protein
MSKFRLLADVRLDGVRHKAGSVIERPEDWRGPMRSARVAINKYGAPLGGTHEDVPLYVKLEDEKQEKSDG